MRQAELVEWSKRSLKKQRKNKLLQWLLSLLQTLACLVELRFLRNLCLSQQRGRLYSCPNPDHRHYSLLKEPVRELYSMNLDTRIESMILTLLRKDLLHLSHSNMRAKLTMKSPLTSMSKWQDRPQRNSFHQSFQEKVVMP